MYMITELPCLKLPLLSQQMTNSLSGPRIYLSSTSSHLSSFLQASSTLTTFSFPKVCPFLPTFLCLVNSHSSFKCRLKCHFLGDALLLQLGQVPYMYCDTLLARVLSWLQFYLYKCVCMRVCLYDDYLSPESQFFRWLCLYGLALYKSHSKDIS